MRVCVAWLTWELTQSKFWLGLVAFAELGPSVLVSLYAGALADRADRFAIIRRGQHVQTALAVLLGILAATGTINTAWMLMVLIGFSIVGGINQPARMSIAPSLVQTRQLPTAAAIGSFSLNLTRFLGPVIAAPLIVASREDAAFFLAAIAFGISSLCLNGVRQTGAVAGSGTINGLRQSYRPVLAAMVADRTLIAVMVLQFAAWMLLRPLTDMMPAFASMYGSGELGFSILSASVGFGALIGAVAAISEGTILDPLRHLVVGTLAAAVIAFLVAFTSVLWAAAPAFFAFGLFLSTTSVVATTCVQLRAPPDRLGRVMSIYGLIVRFAPAIGAPMVGMLAERVGLGNTARVVAVITGCLALWVAWREWRRGN